MKKILITIVLVAAAFVVSSENRAKSDLLSSNIEALAQNETTTETSEEECIFCEGHNVPGGMAVCMKTKGWRTDKDCIPFCMGNKNTDCKYIITNKGTLDVSFCSEDPRNK